MPQLDIFVLMNEVNWFTFLFLFLFFITNGVILRVLFATLRFRTRFLCNLDTREEIRLWREVLKEYLPFEGTDGNIVCSGLEFYCKAATLYYSNFDIFLPVGCLMDLSRQCLSALLTCFEQDIEYSLELLNYSLVTSLWSLLKLELEDISISLTELVSIEESNDFVF